MARIIDVIEVPNQQQDEIVRRLPEYGAGDFRFGSQVNELDCKACHQYSKDQEAHGPPAQFLKSVGGFMLGVPCRFLL